MLCGPASRRVLIRQPSRDVVEAAKEHSPLSGKTKLVDSAPFLFEREIWDGAQWQLDASTTTISLADGLRQLCLKTDSNFLGTIPESIPFVGPFWTGALSYDLLQLTQPIRLQHLPQKGELLCVLWEIHHCIVHEKSTDSLVVLSTDSSWEANVRVCLDNGQPEYTAPTVLISQKPTSTCTDQEHEDIVRRVQSAIVDGQLYQLNFGRTWEGEIQSEPWTVFSHSIASNPAPYSGFVHMKDEGFSLVSASPESLLTTKDGIITTAPIKGTAPRGASDAEESLLREDMISDRKERAEHRMLVDLMRNDIGRISKPNQVWVDRFDVEAYAEVQHLVSRIKGNLHNHCLLYTSPSPRDLG